VGSRALPALGEVYYVMAGEGTVQIGGETAPIKTGDAVPVDVNQPRAFAQSGAEPLEFLIIGVSKDLDSKIAMMNARSPARGGRGVPGASGRGN
jgi:quercetin dioxygenase-like cupin family protein